MKFKIFTIPFDNKNECFFEEELNDFSTLHSVKSYKAEIMMQNGRYFWTVFAEYEETERLSEKKDETKDMDELEIKIYLELKNWRREKAISVSIPPYIIATNGQLKNIVRQKPKNIAELKNINGIGESKTKKYGEDIITQISHVSNDKK